MQSFLKLGFVAVLGLGAVAGCGSHFEVSLTGDPTAARASDDHVTVSAQVTCRTMGVSSCEGANGICVRAAWASSFADQPLALGGPYDDDVTVCHDHSLDSDELDSFALRSTKVVPKGLQVRVEVLTTEEQHLGYAKTMASP